MGVDEYQMYLYAVRSDAAHRVLPAAGRQPGRERVRLAGLAGAAVTAASRSLTGDLVAAGHRGRARWP